MRVFVFIMFLMAFAPAAFPAEGQQPSFDALLQRLRQHPEIQAYVNSSQSSQYYAEGELGLPDPMLTFEQRDYRFRSGMGLGSGDQMLGFKQEIPRPAILRARSEKMQAESRKTGLTADYAFAAMKARLITALASRRSFKEQEKLLEEQEKLFRSERSSIEGRIAANQAGTSRLYMSKADNAELRIIRAELAEQERESENMLMNMVGEVPDIVLPPVKMIAWDNAAEKTYPVKIAAEDVAMAQKEVAAKKAEFGPNFEVSANVGRMDNGDQAGTFMVGVSVPLWSARSQKPRLEGANASLQSSRLEMDSVKRGVVERLGTLKAQIGISDRKIELLKTRNTHLESGAKALIGEYGAGKADFGMYLKARRDALSVRLSLAQERARNIAMIADFNRYFIEGEHP
ncbi:MAG: TolC family protein [Pseudomonadota bacterium]